MRKVAVITGSRADFGLLRSTIDAIEAHVGLDLQVIASGAHLLPPDYTIEDVRSQVRVDAIVEMQRPGVFGRTADAAAVGRGVSGFAEAFERLDPQVVLVLGDRVEAFAAASAASIGGRTLAHVHGGDRAEGVADEAMRHAITKLAHLHFAATQESGERILKFGEPPSAVYVVGSPAIDGLGEMALLDDSRHTEWGKPASVLLLHGAGQSPAIERRWAEVAIEGVRRHGPVAVLRPNQDPGSEFVDQAIAVAATDPMIQVIGHLDRPSFIGLLRRVDVLVGNSSAGLIEAAALGCPAVNLGPRQAGRERPASVIDVDNPNIDRIAEAIEKAIAGRTPSDHPYGNGGSGRRIASVLGEWTIEGPPRKRNAF
jgi:UDP-hydrolysing UDP-N-acetyl-D-glucosamine 2-epimerase